MSYDSVTYSRKHLVDGKENWVWTLNETGAWDGPLSDWENSHKNLYLTHCKNFRTVVQAGGNQGLYPYLFSTFFEHVYTFEPDGLNFHCLVNNCQKDNVYKFNCALGPRAGMVGLHRPTMNNSGMHNVVPGDQIPVLPLDAFDFPHVDLIQLDIEGYEYEALLGAQETIRKHSPVITVERNNEPIRTLLESLGYVESDRSFADTFYVRN